MPPALPLSPIALRILADATLWVNELSYSRLVQTTPNSYCHENGIDIEQEIKKAQHQWSSKRRPTEIEVGKSRMPPYS